MLVKKTTDGYGLPSVRSLRLVAVDRHGKMYFDFVCGDRSTNTGLKLWEKLEKVDISKFCSDNWES